MFQPLDARGRWLCQISYDGTAETFATYTAERCLDWIRRAAGSPEVQAEILSVNTWTMNATVAASFRHGPVLLAGDAAHQLPPTGGFGMNTGVQDVHNVAWKIAAVLQGQMPFSVVNREVLNVVTLEPSSQQTSPLPNA